MNLNGFLQEYERDEKVRDANTNSKGEWMVLSASAIFFAIVLVIFIIRLEHNIQASSLLPPKKLLQSSAFAIGAHPDVLAGKLNSEFTVVEFADYQCPPCKQAFQMLPKITAPFKKKVCVVFRNFPLTGIHPMAYSAACAAEAASLLGKFVRMHNLLYFNQAKLSHGTYVRLAQKLKLNVAKFESLSHSQAATIVNRDISAGKLLGVDATPTIIVCMKDHTVWKLASLSQLPNILSK